MKTPTQDEALRTMIPASEKAKIEFKERQAGLEAKHAPFTQIFAPFVELAQHNPQTDKAIDDLRRLYQIQRTRVMKPPIVPRLPDLPTGLSVTQLEPQFGWTMPPLTEGSGSASATQSVVNRSMTCVTIAGDASGGAEERVALGVSFGPDHNGLLSISALPTLTYDWEDVTVFSSASTFGWIGLFVSSLDSNNNVATLVDMRQVLWDDAIQFFGNNAGSKSDLLFPLSAQVPVDTQHVFFIWVWCGTTSSSLGPPVADADGHLSVRVPFITVGKTINSPVLTHKIASPSSLNG